VVIDPQTQALLQEVLRRESRSLLLYVGNAYPWTEAGGGAALEALRKLIREEASAVTALGQDLARRRVPLPYLGPFPISFTSYNFVSLDFLLPRLAEAQRASVGRLEADLRAVKDAEARAQLEKLLGVKKATLAGLESLAPQPAGA
jgi:hypothetical protein